MISNEQLIQFWSRLQGLLNLWFLSTRSTPKNTVTGLAIKYPLPLLSLTSLLVGSIMRWVFNLPVEAGWLWTITLVLGGAPVIWQTILAIKKGNFASDIVASLAIVAALALGDAFPGVVIVLMQTGGKALEDYAFGRASSSVDALIARSPRFAHRLHHGRIVEIGIEEVAIRDRLLVRPGDLIPVDGFLASSTATLDESSLTGEPQAKTKSRGEKLFSGTVNVGDAFEMEAEKTSGESQYAKIVELVRKAQQEKAPIQRLADKYAIWFTPITVAMAIIGWVITRQPETFLSVVVVATPCSLIFATPVAIISGINKAAKQGIIIKHGAAIEQIGKAKAAVFDKTGTLTSGSLEVKNIVSYGNMSADELLFEAASVEQLSSHPAAQVVVAKGQRTFNRLAIPVDFREVAGAGVQGIVEGKSVMVGSERLFSNAGLVMEWPEGIDLNGLKADNGMVAFIAVNGRFEGAIVLNDPVRPGVASMITDLHSIGVKFIALLTGDNQANGDAVARNTGIDSVEANLLPKDKVLSVKKLREKYHNVVMVGDGINDAPALASATVGVAMGSKGTAISAEAADVVLLVDDVTKVTEAMKTSQRTISIARQSIFIGLGSSLVLMAIASVGFIPPTVGALLQELLDVAVILNAIRAR